LDSANPAPLIIGSGAQSIMEKAAAGAAGSMAMGWTVKAALRAAVMDSGASSDSPALIIGSRAAGSVVLAGWAVKAALRAAVM